ncbi:MAG TPA: hypothetical protein VIU62_01930 [Chloroflexota bacterium]|jgi:hypothetical protein
MSSRVATLSGDGDRLRQGLAALTRALWWSESAVWLTRGVAGGLFIAILTLLAARFVNLPIWLPLAAIACGVLAGAGVAATRPRSMGRTALLADRRLDLRERLTTAWELQRRGLDSPLVVAQLADATAHLRLVKPFGTFPIRLPRQEAAIGTVLVLVALALWLVPNPHRLDVQRQQAERQLISQQAQAVGQLAQQIQAAAGPQPSAEQATTIQALKQLQSQLDSGKVTTADALAALTAAEDRLRSQDSTAATTAKAGLDQAAATLAASQGGDPTAQALGQSIGQGQYSQAAAQLQQLAKDAQQMTQQQRDALQSTLHAAGAAAAKSDPALGQALQQAANSLGSSTQPGSPAAQQQAFNQAASALQQAGQTVTSDSQAQQALAQVQGSEATLSAAQQAAAGQSASAQPGAQGNQAQQVSSLSNPAAGSQTGNPSDTTTAGQPADSAGQSSQAAQGSGASQQAGTSAAAGQGQGQTAGQGQSGQGTGSQPGAGSGSGQGAAGGHGSGGGPGGQVYAPQTVAGHQEQLPNSATGPGQQVAANGSGSPQNNQSLVPYNQVIGTYQQQAAQAMDQSHVPLDSKNLVRDYFSALAAGN